MAKNGKLGRKAAVKILQRRRAWVYNKYLEAQAAEKPRLLYKTEVQALNMAIKAIEDIRLQNGLIPVEDEDLLTEADVPLIPVSRDAA